MANENKKITNKQEKKRSKQPTIPVEQVELSDEELKQVVGGGIKVPDSPAVQHDGIRVPDGVIIDY